MRTPSTWSRVSAVIALGGALVLYLFWPRGYGETSDQGYQFAIALFTACNQHDSEKLTTIANMIEAAEDAGELGNAEARWLQGITRQGLAGNWEAANRAVRRLMTDQLKPAPLPSAES